jgi:hypothetical protein
MSAYFIFVVCITLNPESEIHLQLAQHSQIRTDIVYIGVRIICSGGVYMEWHVYLLIVVYGVACLSADCCIWSGMSIC